MRPQSIGRALGTGLRVAGRIVAHGIGAAVPARPPGGSLRRGLAALLRPLGRAGGILWLELTGSFFLLFALIFVRGLWHFRSNCAHGPNHGKFLADAAMVAIFLYLGVTSFWRARNR